MKIRNLYFLNIVWLLIPATIIEKTFAQAEKLRFEHLGVEQGLADNTVIDLMKDSKGYL